VAVFTQAPEQRESPELQTAPHEPPEHTAVPFVTAGHTVPQAPQFLTLVLVSTQLSPQRVVGKLHAKSQPLDLHVGIAFGGDVHAVPHARQFDVSLVKSTHEPLHAVRVPQSAEQTPDLHNIPAPQAVLQSPQCLPFACVSTHCPLQSV
jgi:hypothetical protein